MNGNHVTQKASLGKVLVTGGAGFIGSALSQLIADRSEGWVVMDSLHPQVHPGGKRPADLHEKAELIVGDVVNPEDWDRVLEHGPFDLVVHLAAETGTAQSLAEASRHSRVNVVGTTEMLDAFTRAGQIPARIVLAGSRAVYGEGRWTHESDGTDFYPGMRTHAQLAASQWDFPGAAPVAARADLNIPTPTSIYGATKLAQENLLTAWAGSHDTTVNILRLQNVYGPGQSLINSYTGIVSLFSQWSEIGKQIPVYEDGVITRDFVYIDDVATAFEAVIDSDPAVTNGQVYDVGNGVGTTIFQIAEIIAEYHGAPAPTVNGAFRDGDVRHAWADISRTTEVLGWSPAWNVRTGVAALQEWIAGQDERVV